MESFGENLRRERELRGITLPELANATKVSVRHLQALERNQFDQLPGGVFSRGFVRAVARYLKLDDKHWVAEFARAAHEPPEILARYVPNPPASSRRSRAGLSGFVLLLVAFGVGAYFVHEARVQRAAEAAQPSATPAMGTTAPAGTEASPAEHLVSQRTAAVPVAAPAPAAATLHLQVDTIEDSWVSVKPDGQPGFEGMMRARESRSFTGKGRIEVVAGNASAVVLTLNGETLPPMGHPGERKSVVLTARDLKPPTP